MEAPVNTITPAGFVTNWVLLGPFLTEELPLRLGDGVSRSGFHRDFLEPLGGEADAVLRPGMTLTYDAGLGRRRKVRAIQVGPELDDPARPKFRHILDGRHILFRDFDLAVGYAFCWLRSGRAQQVFAYLGADGSPKVYLNGRLVHQAWRDFRKTVPWEDGLTLNLKSGLNPLLIKIDNAEQYWGFQIEIYDHQHHRAGISRAWRGLAIQQLCTEGSDCFLRVVTAPRAVGFRMPVKVDVQDASGHRLAEASTETGKLVSLRLPEDFTGIANISACPVEEEFLAKFKPRPERLFVGDLRGAASALAARFAEARRDLGFLGRHWAPLYDGLCAWLEQFFTREPDPTSGWTVGSYEYAGLFVEALEKGLNWASTQAGKSLPVAFRGRDRQDNVVAGSYLVTLPEGYDPERRDWPLLINLRGSGNEGRPVAFGESNIPLFDELRPLLIRVTPASTHRSWDTRMLDCLLEDLKSRLAWDPERLYLQGGSGGGVGAWDWLMENPGPFAAAVILVGFDGYPFRAARLKHVPLWVFNGEQDLASEPYMPELMVNALRRAGADVTYTNFPERAHAVSASIDKSEWLNFLLRRRRKARRVPRDPLESLRLGADGIGPHRMVKVPASSAVALAALHNIAYPQDNVFRAVSKIFERYRDPQGWIPRRLADGTAMIRSAKGDSDGPMQLLLEAPEAAAAAAQSQALALVKLPAMVAAEVHLRCADSWEALRARKQIIYRRLESAGFRLTGEERNCVLVPRARKECRYWRLLIGVRRMAGAGRSR